MNRKSLRYLIELTTLTKFDQQHRTLTADWNWFGRDFGVYLLCDTPEIR